MRYLSLILLLELFLVGCESQQSDSSSKQCITEDPLREMTWLSAIVDSSSMEHSALQIFEYKGDEQTMIMVNYCVGCANAPVLFYDCEGRLLCEKGCHKSEQTCFEVDQSRLELVYHDTVNTSSDQNSCNYENPLNELVWLQTLVQENEGKPEIMEIIVVLIIRKKASLSIHAGIAQRALSTYMAVRETCCASLGQLIVTSRALILNKILITSD